VTACFGRWVVGEGVWLFSVTDCWLFGLLVLFEANSQAAVPTGNAGAVGPKGNGRDLGALGGSGQVVKTSFGPGDPTAETG